MLFTVRQTLGSRTVKDETRLNFDPVMTAESGFTSGDSKIVSENLLHKLLQKYCSTFFIFDITNVIATFFIGITNNLVTYAYLTSCKIRVSGVGTRSYHRQLGADTLIVNILHCVAKSSHL